MLESFRKGQRWLTLIFVSVIGLVFVFFFGVGGSFGPPTPTGGAIVELDEIQLTTRDFGREKQNTELRLRSQLGDAFDQVGAERYVDSQALGSMINQVVLATAAKEMGLHVTKDEVRRVVQSSTAFIDADGRFSPDAFNYYAQREYGTQRAFLRTFTRELLGQKLVQLLVAHTTVSDGEIDLRTRYELDEVRIAYVDLTESSLPEAERPSDEEIEAYAEKHAAELREAFAARAEALSLPERIRARHLLIQLPADATEIETGVAQAKVDAARTRIEQGEAFDAVVAEVSDDAATRSLGGDLGTFSRGQNDPALDEAAFGLEVGVLSEPIRSAYGFHLVEVQEKLPAVTATFDGSRLDLAREAATLEKAQARSADLALQISEAIENGGDLEQVARERGLTLERPPALKRRPDGFVPGLNAAPELLTTAFTLEAGESSPQIFELPGRRVLIQVVERNVASDEDVAAERAERRERVLTEKQNQTVEAWLADYRRELEEAGRLRINAELALGS